MFKRNQIEEAIAHVFEPGLAKPSSEMRTRVKRLLETDRGLGRNKRSAHPESANFAFYSMDEPGRGVENWFSGYEAFALLIGLRLMRLDWPQGLAVAVLRRVKPELKKHHARILTQDPAVLSDEQRRQRAKPGDLDVDNPDPVFLAINSTDRKDRSGSNPAAICRGQNELMRFIKAQGVGQTCTVLELGNSVHALSSALAKTTPRKRGRGSQ
ncbi:MAG: hypothetical protein ABR973_16590 [Candidatus Acidiferrales bacterium]|jgi:hypothetical protein